VRLPLLLAATLAVFLVACGGGGDENKPSPAATSAAKKAAATAAPASATATATAAATVEDRAATEALLKAASLQLEDLPSGFTLDDERFTTNEEAAAEQEGNPRAATLEDLNGFGRILGYEASYSQDVSATGSALSFQMTTTVYRDSKGAGEHFRFVREQTSDPEFIQAFEDSLAGSGVEVKDATISPMSFADVGDDHLALELKVTAHSPDLDADFDVVSQLVGVRRDRGIGAITVTAVGSPESVGELEDLARTLDERLKDALE